VASFHNLSAHFLNSYACSDFSKLCDSLVNIQSRSHRGAFGGGPLKLFCAPQILLFPEKFVLNVQHKQNLAPLKMYFFPKTLKPGYGPGSTSHCLKQFCVSVLLSCFFDTNVVLALFLNYVLFVKSAR